MQLLWVALSLMGLMTIAFVTLVAWGLDLSHDYSELLLLIGLLAFITCTVAYFADKEREHRRQNRELIQQLKETAEALDSRVTRLNKLCETSVHLSGTLDVNAISELVVNALVDQVRADTASLVLMDKTKGERLFSTSTGRLAEAASDSIAVATAGAEGGPAMHDMKASPELTDQLRAWERVREAISAPVKITDMVGGTLAAIREEKFDPEDLNLLTTLANMSGKALENAELHERLRQSYYRTLHSLARSLAARDPYSAAHGEAVTWLACRLAEELGLGPEALKAYTPLHDLGKIGIPDALLLKAGPLTEEEVSIVRQHTIIGEEIIAPLLPGDTALAMIRSHHEHWNGAGYPDGLRGERIPLLARVVAVADAYHAMISHRSYRGARVPSEAVQEIKGMAGVQFDPAVVEALDQVWERGEVAKFSLRLGRSFEPYDLPELPRIVLPGVSAGQGVA
jgi:HD-GYP domain-containing protein (c-di-GMP phosphodiesterase class II)